jgi:peptidoglycan/LPS O-acetylase OafA/YrhL
MATSGRRICPAERRNPARLGPINRVLTAFPALVTPPATSPLRSSERRRLDALDGLRGAAAFGIVILHVWMFHQGDLGAPERGTLDTVISQLRLGMPMFFVLSGFLIFRPFAAAAIDGHGDPDLRTYAIRRAARVVPAYWVAIVIPAALLALLDHGQARPVEQLPIYLLFAQNYVEATSQGLNPPTWTIVVEVSFYAAVPILAVLLAWLTARVTRPEHRRTVLALVCLVLLLVGAYVLGQCAINGPNHSPLKDSLLGRLNSFAAGMLAAVLVHRRSARTGPAAVLAAGGIALLLSEAVVRGYGLLDATLRDQIVDTPASVGVAMLIAAVALAKLPGEAIFARGPLQWYGKLSYGLYLWHFPVIYALRSLELWPSSLLGACVAVIVPSTLLAMVSWSLLEKPAMEWARRRTATAAQRTPVPPEDPGAAAEAWPPDERPWTAVSDGPEDATDDDRRVDERRGVTAAGRR